jgi:putative spermidine/putrescine transport system permease protein
MNAAAVWRTLRITCCALTVVFLVAPMAIVVVISFSSAQFLTFPPPGLSLQWYRKLFGDPEWASTLITSVEIVIPTGLLATACGTAAALALARARMPGRSVLTGILMAPLVVPIIVIAAAMFSVFSDWGLNGSLLGFVIAHTVITIPYVISIVMAALSTVSEQYENAALTLGATHWVAFRRILFPLIAPSVLSGLLFAMVVSFDELVVSLFISTPTFRPVTVQMWSDVMGDVDPTIAAIGSLLFVFSLVVLLVESLVSKGRTGARAQPQSAAVTANDGV